MSHPSNITRANTLRIAADLVDLATNLGATIEAGVSVYSAGRASISVNGALSGGCIPDSDIAAWQLASGVVWDVTTYHYTCQGNGQSTRACDFDWHGIRVSLSLIEQTAQVTV